MNFNIKGCETLQGSCGWMSSSDNVSGSSDLPSIGYLLHRDFVTSYLGCIQEANLGGATTNTTSARDPDVQLIDKIEEAQLEGKINFVPKDEDIVTLTISKYGIKVVDRENVDVLQRHPLYSIAQVVFYADSFGRSNVALKVGQVGRSVYDCYVFQCRNEDDAQSICQTVKDLFDSIVDVTS